MVNTRYRSLSLPMPSSQKQWPFADLVLPDTTYLERHDVMSMLDRPISEFEGPVDSVRIPVIPPKGDCKPFNDVIIELGHQVEAACFHQYRRQSVNTVITRIL